VNNSNQISPVALNRMTSAGVISDQGDLPLTVRDAARFLGVSQHNIRFLKSDLEPFREQFKQEVENGKTKQA
jgi:hypothetical protein